MGNIFVNRVQDHLQIKDSRAGQTERQQLGKDAQAHLLLVPDNRIMRSVRNAKIQRNEVKSTARTKALETHHTRKLGKARSPGLLKFMVNQGCAEIYSVVQAGLELDHKESSLCFVCGSFVQRWRSKFQIQLQGQTEQGWARRGAMFSVVQCGLFLRGSRAACLVTNVVMPGDTVEEITF